MQYARGLVGLLIVLSWLVLATTAAAQDLVPPGGELLVDGAGPYDGTLGSNCVANQSMAGCSDSPWLTPKTGPTADPGAPLEFRLDGAMITSWVASYGDAAEADPEASHIDDAEDQTAKFTGPLEGDWVISVFVEFEGDNISGDATYNFRLHAGMPETDSLATPALPGTPSRELALVLLAGATVGAVAGWRLRRPSPATG